MTAFLTITFISIMLSVLPRVFYPISVLPAQVRWLAELVPAAHASALIQGFSGLPVPSVQIEISWVTLPVFTIVFLALALLKAR